MPSSFPDFGWEEGEGGGRKVATGKQSIFLSSFFSKEAFFGRDIKRLFSGKEREVVVGDFLRNICSQSKKSGDLMLLQLLLLLL